MTRKRPALQKTRLLSNQESVQLSMANRLLPYAMLFVTVLFTVIFYPADFMVAWIFAWALVYDELSSLYAGFLGGIALDLLLFTPLGSISVLVILHAFCLIALTRLRIAKRWYALCLIIALVFASYIATASFVRTGAFAPLPSLPRLVIDCGIAGVMYSMFVYFFGPKEHEPLRLKLG